MRLRTRVVVLLAVTNAAVFGVLAAFVLGDVKRRSEMEREGRLAIARELVPLLIEAFKPFEPGSQGLDVASVESWPNWLLMRDAVIMDERRVRLTDEGPTVATGLVLNPLGVAHRSPSFDITRVKRLAQEAIERGRPLEDGEGYAVPITSGKTIRGAAYLIYREPIRSSFPFIGLFLGLVASTVALTGVAGIVINVSVVRPVERLAEVGRRVVAGDLAAEPAPHPAGDEMTGLSESIRTMLRTLRAHRDELQRASDAAAARATKAERDLLVAQRLASIGTLASGIAHEINNPLGGLTNAMRRLEKGDLPPEKRTEYFALVLDGLERIRGIVGRVLSIAPRAIGPTSVSVAEAARAAVAFVEHRAARESVRIETRLSDAGDAIQGDRGEIVQVFLNLLVNALDAIAARRARDGRGGLVRVEVRRDGAHVSALVEDDGTGMIPAQLHRVFDPFFTTKEPGQGTGLGLTLVYALVRNHGGTIDVRNRDGGGFAALLQIPAAP